MPSFLCLLHFQLLDTSGWPESACAECIYILDGMKTLKAAILKSHRVLYEHLKDRNGSPMDSDFANAECVKREVAEELEDTKTVIPKVEDKEDLDLKAPIKEEEDISENQDMAAEEVETSGSSSEAEESADVKISTKKAKHKRRKKADEDSLEEVMHTMDLLKCHECQHPNDSLKDLFKHFRKEHNNSRGYIFCCDKKKIGRVVAFDHIRVHVDQDAFKCRSCDQRYPTKWSLEYHIRQVHTHPQDRRFMCDVCGKTFANRPGFEDHIKYHTAPEDRQYRCTICDGGFTSPYQLKRHVLRLHERGETHICEQCGRGFTQQSLLSTHIYKKHRDHRMDSLHKGCKRMHCEKCGTLVSERNMQAHLANNCFKGDSPLICIFCEMKLKTKKSLMSHMRRVHPERTSMSCAHCQFEADTGTDLMRHTRDHHPTEFAKLKYTFKE